MICCACNRAFGGLTGFDAHQDWQPIGFGPLPNDRYLTCRDPATMTRRDGSRMFKQDSKGRWCLLVGKKHPHAS